MENCTPNRPLRILLADDSEDNRFLIEKYLEHLPYQIDMAVNGKEAIESATHNLYDLILMDIQMPEVDGFTATKEIRLLEKNEGRVNVPILAVTAQNSIEKSENSEELGFNGHLRKPLKKNVLLDAIIHFTSK